MKPVTEYRDYRSCMQDFYDERKRTCSFTWREFARLAGFTSPTYLKLVCEGKSSLSELGIERVAAAMNLGGFEYAYFRSLVHYNQAKDDETKKNAFASMKDIAKANKIRVVDADAFTYFESWKNPVLRELVAMMPGATPKAVAEMCWQPITADEVRKSLNFMVSVGILQRKSKNVYVQTEKALVGNSDVMPLVLRSMHREMACFAQKAIDEFDVNDRDVSGITMGIDRDTYEQIVRELESCRRKIVAIANTCKEPNQVYRLNLQMFPLAKNTQKNEG
ncbi:TIGR02147 family protein [uncultured Fibrobacter sp.]|uniref:TIGR02147 family protein n=1 Tax=uncultured Fibrobacter sp. TaxID=261512 RepID=UPI0026248D59|nr:TIGR02147 family protein [uncultured Fibrobacter sp.]